MEASRTPNNPSPPLDSQPEPLVQLLLTLKHLIPLTFKLGDPMNNYQICKGKWSGRMSSPAIAFR